MYVFFFYSRLTSRAYASDTVDRLRGVLYIALLCGGTTGPSNTTNCAVIPVRNIKLKQRKLVDITKSSVLLVGYCRIVSLDSTREIHGGGRKLQLPHLKSTDM